MATGINYAYQFDPATKEEIWLLQKIGTTGPGAHGRTLYRRLGYNLVRYDGQPTELIEPVNGSGDFVNLVDETGDPIIPNTDGVGRVVEIRFCERRPFEMVGFGEVDAGNNLGQLP